ncbi:hypothetical protein BDQ17DRAFT_1430209 [Cyathus striatus]|nr:hypothetical protein BDQ17DRAFT_1430209 [Cyathus striatus]
MIVSCIFAIVPFIAPVVIQSLPSVVCVAVRATLSAPGQMSLHLLPGQYTSSTNPQLLHTLLTSSSALLSPSAGFNAALSTLPLNLVLSPGLSIFSDAGYSSDSSFTELPTSPNTSLSTSLSAKSIALAEIFSFPPRSLSQVYNLQPALPPAPAQASDPPELASVHQDLPVHHVNPAPRDSSAPHARLVLPIAHYVTKGSMVPDAV